MNSLNLKGFVLSIIACVLVSIMMSFPAYIASLMVDTPALLFVVALLSASLVLYIHRQIGNAGYGMLILKLALLTISYIFCLTAVAQLSNFSFNNNNYRALLAVTALYSIGLLFLFKNPYLRIYANTVLITSTTLMFLTNLNHIIFWGYCLPILLSIFIVLSLSANAIRYYTFLIAFVIVLVVMNSILVSIGTFNIYRTVSTHYIIINYLPIFALVPLIVKNRNSLSPKFIITLITSVIILAILLTVLPISVVSGILIVAIAFYLQSRTIHILGIILFIGSLYFYYYNLNTTLSMKGLILIGSGIVILIIQWIVRRFVLPNIMVQEENNHAN